MVELYCIILCFSQRECSVSSRHLQMLVDWLSSDNVKPARISFQESLPLPLESLRASNVTEAYLEHAHLSQMIQRGIVDICHVLAQSLRMCYHPNGLQDTESSDIRTKLHWSRGRFDEVKHQYEQDQWCCRGKHNLGEGEVWVSSCRGMVVRPTGISLICGDFWVSKDLV